MSAKAASFVLSMAIAISTALPISSWAAGPKPVLDAQSQAMPKGSMDLAPWQERDAARKAAMKSRARGLGLEKIAGMASLAVAKLTVINQVLLPMSKKPQSQVGPKELTEISKQKGELIMELEEINEMLQCLLEDEQAKSFGIKEL